MHLEVAAIEFGSKEPHQDRSHPDAFRKPTTRLTVPKGLGKRQSNAAAVTNARAGVAVLFNQSTETSESFSRARSCSGSPQSGTRAPGNGLTKGPRRPSSAERTNGKPLDNPEMKIV